MCTHINIYFWFPMCLWVLIWNLCCQLRLFVWRVEPPAVIKAVRAAERRSVALWRIFTESLAIIVHLQWLNVWTRKCDELSSRRRSKANRKSFHLENQWAPQVLCGHRAVTSTLSCIIRNWMFFFLFFLLSALWWGRFYWWDYFFFLMTRYRNITIFQLLFNMIFIHSFTHSLY